jgi:hypothetical protein
MDLIRRAINGITNLSKPTYNIREVIPGWDDDYPEPTFTDEWELTSDLDLDNDDMYTVCRDIVSMACSDDNHVLTFDEWVGDTEISNDVFDRYFGYQEEQNENCPESSSLDNEDYLTRIDNGTFNGFNEEETRYLDLTSGCYGCKYFHGTAYGGVDFICPIHPSGNENCVDFESE